MLSQDTKISEFNENQKSDKTPFIIYADPKCIIENNDGCKSNPEISSITKVGKYIPPGLSLSTVSTLRGKENKYDV